MIAGDSSDNSNVNVSGSETPVQRLPRQVPIDAYGNGGFRFADMSHRGSLLCLPSAMIAWPVTDVQELTPDHFAAVFSEPAKPKFLLFGTGTQLVVPSDAVYGAFKSAGIGLEPMATGSAARTYNVLLAEDRKVAAALIAVA